MTDLAMPSANSWFGIRLLPFVLSLTAGSMDVIGFLGLGGLFTAQTAAKSNAAETQVAALTVPDPDRQK